uniref:Myc-associated zinc finger n=1 Tax=Mycena chlorophos TaxID=658473 RepID=A0ABQ0LV03_MYCCL|nr:myc-associated zinc finger [Mycena chlorophos]
MSASTKNTIRHDAPYTSTIRHEEAVDGRVYCPTCPGPRKYFATQASLEDHYRSKPDHPNCPRCGKGFATPLVRDEHFRSFHIKEKCPGCGKEIFQEDMAAHCLNSPEHSACSKCTIGFKTEADFTDHCRTIHSERFDERCTRFFQSDEEQEEHYKISVNHPTCEECGKGLVDNAAHEEHLRVVHPNHHYRSVPLPKPQGNGTWPSPVYGLQNPHTGNSLQNAPPSPHAFSVGASVSSSPTRLQWPTAAPTMRSHRNSTASMPGTVVSTISTANNGYSAGSLVRRTQSTSFGDGVWGRETTSSTAGGALSSVNARHSSPSSGWSSPASDTAGGFSSRASFECPNCGCSLQVAIQTVVSRSPNL